MTSAANNSWIALVLASPLVTGCLLGGDCDRAGCKATSKPVKDASITAGIAGSASSQSDVVANGCNECTLTSGDLTVWSTATAVANKDEAQMIVQNVAPDQTIMFDDHYEQELAAGEYLVCAGSSEMTCAGITIPDAGVVTVHVRYIFGPTQMTVFEPGATDPRMDRMWEIFVP